MTGLDRLHEIAEDVGRTVWLRELGAALRDTADAIEGGTRDLSGYESDVLAWVEKSGGLDAVKERTMPEGMSWPFYEDGEPVRLGEHWQQDGYDWSITSIDSIEFAEDGVRFENEYADAFYRYGERVKRPAPQVLDADGVEIRVGDTVYLLPGDWCDRFPCLGYHGGEELEVFSFHADHVEGCVCCRDTWRPKATCYPQPSQLTHRAPVLAADGEPLREGETVWNVKTGERYMVGAFASGCVNVSDGRGGGLQLLPSQLTHTKPEPPDTWERIEEDAYKDDCEYFGRDLNGCEGCPASRQDIDNFYCDENEKASDLVRRAKALAGVS